MKRSLPFVVAPLGLLWLIGCSSFFEDRVEKLDREIDAVQAEILATPPAERAHLIEKLGKLEDDRRQAMDAAQTEQANKQALLLASIGILSTGIKLFGGAAKGAV